MERLCDSLVAPAVNEVDGQEAVAQIVFKGIVERCLGTVENDGAGRSTAILFGIDEAAEEHIVEPCAETRGCLCVGGKYRGRYQGILTAETV